MPVDIMKTRMKCLDCEETFPQGEMYPGKRYIDPLRCPYCKGDQCWPEETLNTTAQ